ncbi:hypothetical protein BFW01_g204 [Lasiodiplodia theobromae]|uniref:Uncharacterized protein n=1 Tax=Lasiodiplodia theobromae TaxID=45133 RepID=A0A8H7MAX0_9PEZI|nr:hypothetical protein BFW01_g204 [Lasiodiplodia theobromae]
MASNSSSKPAIQGISYSCQLLHKIAGHWGHDSKEWFPKDAVPAHGKVDKLSADYKNALLKLAEAAGAKDRAVAVGLVAQAIKERKESSWNRFAGVEDIKSALARYETVRATTAGLKPTFVSTVTVQTKHHDISVPHGVRRARSQSSDSPDARAPQRRRLEQPKTADTIESLTANIDRLKLEVTQLKAERNNFKLQTLDISSKDETIKGQSKIIKDQDKTIMTLDGERTQFQTENTQLQTENSELGELAITFCKAWLASLVNNKHSSSAAMNINNYKQSPIATTDINKAMRTSIDELQHKLSLHDVIPKVGAARDSINHLVATLDGYKADGLWYHQRYAEKDQVDFEAAPEDVEEDELEVEGYGSEPDDDDDEEMDMDDGGVSVGYFPFDLFKDDLEEENMEEMEE